MGEFQFNVTELVLITLVLVTIISDLVIYYKYNYQSIIFNKILVFIMLLGNPISGAIMFFEIHLLCEAYFLYNLNGFEILFMLISLFSLAFFSHLIYKIYNAISKTSIYNYSKFSFFTILSAFVIYITLLIFGKHRMIRCL